MVLVADSGSTKAAWRAIAEDGSVKEIESEGINPVFMSEVEIDKILEKVADEAGDAEKIYFYSAGVVGVEPTVKLRKCFAKIYPDAELIVASDILAAARAVCGRKSGIVCILGTGSNCCFYDGVKTSSDVKAGGFILGDEGSGAYLGKKLLSDFIKKMMPLAIEREFKKRFPDLNYATIVRKVYSEPMPSRFLASFSPFISEFRNHPYMATLLKSSFEEFIKRNVIHYDYMHNPVSFVGSIADEYSQIIEKCLSGSGIRLGRIVKSPIDGLVVYHKEA